MSRIEWTDKTWNPVVGCSRTSPGCDHCYAIREARRHDRPGTVYEGTTTKRTRAGLTALDWTSKVVFVPERLSIPLRRREPTTWFVNSMSDLFHHSVTDHQIAAIFGIMAATPRHRYQILTKRADRMRDWLDWAGRHPRSCLTATLCLAHVSSAWHCGSPSVKDAWDRAVWPLPNVAVGVSAENQEYANTRIPLLLETRAAVRIVSLEPLLGPVDFSRVPGFNKAGSAGLELLRNFWIICGGESGPGARPFHADWARAIRAQCKLAGVPFFMKQMGGNVRDRNDAGFDGDHRDAWDLGERLFDAIEHNPDGVRDDYQGAPVRIRLRNRKGADPSEWPVNLRVQQPTPFGGAT